MSKKPVPNLVGRVLSFTDHGRRINVSFALVVRQTPKCVFLKLLPQVKEYDDPLRYIGKAVPDLMKINSYFDLPPKDLFRAKVEWNEDGSLGYAYFRNHLFILWNGEPLGFDHMD